MNEDLRRRYVRDLIADLEQVGGARLEQWIRPLWDHVANGTVKARGVNLKGNPILGTVDGIWPDGSVSEASSEQGYFKPPYAKLRHDFLHALSEVPHARTIRLFSTQVAGPTADMAIERRRRSLERRGYFLDVWDGRRIAEYIVDKLLLDERYVERVGDALPNLRRIAEQNAANSRLPALDSLYQGRDNDEQIIIDRLHKDKCVVISGLGGIGKTELACSVAHRVRGSFALVVWAEGERVTSFESLRSFDVRLNGYTLNVLNLLSDNKTLLVLDNAKTDLNLTALAAECGEHSRVLITSQVDFGGSAYALSFVGRERARDILSDQMPEPCPDLVLDQVLEAVEAHPLVLRMLNGIAIRSGWDAVARQCPHIAAAPDEKRRTVAARILEQHLGVLGSELAFFAWCRCGVVDRALFEHQFGGLAIESLKRWALTSRGQSDAVHLHDLVYQCVERIRNSLPIDKEQFKTGLERYIASQIAPKRLGFFRVANRHAALIEELLRQHPEPGAIRYAYLHGHPPSHLDQDLIGDPSKDVTGQTGFPPLSWLLSIVEAVEADYRRLRDLGNKDAARTLLAARLAVFDVLIGRTNLPSKAVAIATHHRAKTLLKLGREAEARDAFEGLMDDPTVQYSAKLQVARLSKNDPSYAKHLIFEIIEAERRQAGTVSTSVLLETLETLRRPHLRRAVREMTERFGPFMAQQIKAAACSGEDQPIRAFAAVGTDWAYREPELFLGVLDDIDLGKPEEAEDDEERTAIARVLTTAGKYHLRQGKIVEARRNFERALSFFSIVKRRTAFICTHHGDALIRLERFQEAVEILEEVPPEQRDPFWLLRRSEAHLALREHEKASADIEEALLRPISDEYRSTFLAQQAEVLFARGDSSFREILAEAIAQCQDDQYRDELQRRLDQRNRLPGGQPASGRSSSSAQN